MTVQCHNQHCNRILTHTGRCPSSVMGWYSGSSFSASDMRYPTLLSRIRSLRGMKKSRSVRRGCWDRCSTSCSNGRVGGMEAGSGGAGDGGSRSEVEQADDGYYVFISYNINSRAWCKTIVTTSFYIRSYNSFAPSPQ